MASYLIQVAYTPEAWATLIRNPQNRAEAVRPAVERLGGTMVHTWGSFGDYDIVVVVEMPDSVSAAALAISFASGGAVKACKTTPLLSMDETVAALSQAGSAGYRPPAG